MSDKPRPWPNNAKDARDRAAEAAQTGLANLIPLVEGARQFTDLERLRKEANALNALYTILRLLESVGACTRP